MPDLAPSQSTATSGKGWVPPSAADMTPLLPGCEVLSLLGRGGMGAVYLARQSALDRAVAVKVLPVENSVDEIFAQRFVREARAMARLSHPHIVPVFESGQTSAGHWYFVMEFVDGANLHTLIREKRVTPAAALDFAAQVCAALACAHAQGIVHRDIKPANVLIDPQAGAKVVDFGIARVVEPGGESFHTTQTGLIVGTPDYMAPEQMRGLHVDHRADLYSLGVMLYEMLCGEVPRGVFAPPSRRIGCSARLDRIVLKAMQQDPAARYQSAEEMQRDLEAARAALRQAAPERSRILLAALVLVALAGGAGWLFWPKAEPVVAVTPSGAPLAMDTAAKHRFVAWVQRVGDENSHVVLRVPGAESEQAIHAQHAIPPGEWEIVEVWLDRSRSPAEQSPVTAADFVGHMQGLTALRSLFVRDVAMPDAAYAFLARNPGLESLVIERSSTGDDVMPFLTGLKKLRKLSIHTTPHFTARGLERLACLPVLEKAHFYWTRTGDAAAAVLGTCPALLEAHFESTPLTDAGLLHLRKLPRLRKIALNGTAVTPEGQAAFRSARPECELLP